MYAGALLLFQFDMGAMGTTVVGNSRTTGVDPSADPDAH